MVMDDLYHKTNISSARGHHYNEKAPFLQSQKHVRHRGGCIRKKNIKNIKPSFRNIINRAA